MKKTISLVIAIVLILSTVLTVPLVFADNTVVTITNTYEEDGLGTTASNKLKGNNIFHLGKKSAAGRDGGVLQLFPISGQTSIAAGDITYVEIYNPNDADFASFKPEVGKTYKITFDFKVQVKNNDIFFNIRGVTKDGLGDILANATTIAAGDPNYTGNYYWGTATTYVTVREELSALAISIESEKQSDVNYYPYLDNIELTESDFNPGPGGDEEDTSETNNTYEELELGSVVNGVGANKLKGNNIFHLGKKSASERDGRVLQLFPISGQTSIAAGDITYVEIYDPNDANFTSFKPEVGKNYKITFDFKVQVKNNDIFFNIRGVTKDGLGDILVNATTIAAGDPNYTGNYYWGTATTYVTVEEELSAFAISIESDKQSDVNYYPYLDNIKLTQVASIPGQGGDNDDEEVTAEYNTYEETGLGTLTNGSGTHKLKGENIYHLGTKTASGRDGRVLQFKSITGQTNAAAGNITHVELYNPKDANFASFKPEVGTTYEITFDYKVKAGQTAKISFNIRGVTKDGLGDILANAVTIQPKDPAYTDYTWGTATAYVAVTEELSALAISVEISTAGDAGSLYPYLDNIMFKKFTVTNDFKNTYEESGLGSLSNGGAGSHKLKGKYIFHLGTKTASGRDGRVLQFSAISGQTNIAKGNITHVELYNPYDANFASVKPQKNTTYRIKFDYKIKAGTSGDISFNIRGVTTDGIGDILANAVTIVKKDPVYADYTWGSATVFVKTGDEELSAMAISIEIDIAGNATLYPYLDNIDVSVVPEGNTTLKCHNFDVEQITLPNTTLFADIPVELVSGKKFEGWYLDADLKTPAEDNIYGHTEVWAKWRTAGDEIKNTYDDNDVYFGTDENGNITRYSDSALSSKIDGSLSYSYFAKGAVVEDETYGTAIQLADAAIISNTNPALVRIYDNTKSDKSLYIPRSNTVYKISFDIKSTALLDYDTHIAVRAHNNLSNTFGKGEFLNYLYTVRDGISINNWTKVEGYITVPDAKFDFLGISLATSKNTANTTGAQIWIDNIVITEVMDTEYLILHPENGEKDFYVPFVAGEDLPTIPQVEKEGYIFVGWYTDAAKTVPFTYDKMPAENVDIYAKWAETAQTATELHTGFETDDFNSGVTPYVNTGTDNKYTNNMSTHTSVITDESEAYEGEKYLHLAFATNTSKQTMNMPSFAVINPDGSNFQVKSGERYRIKLALRSDYDCYIVPVVTKQVPTGKLNFDNSTEISRIYYRSSIYHSADTWGEMDAYFMPNVSGKVSFLVYLPSCSYMDIDALSIDVLDSSEASLVNFYNEAGTSVKSKAFGGVGNWLFTPVPAVKEGYVFDGWYDSEGNQYVKSVYPKGDLNLYPKYRKVEDLSNPETLKEGTLKIDFEADSANAQAFYQSNKNSFIDNKDAIFVADDPSGAHSGGNYLKFNNAGQWEKAKYRRFRIYDDNSVGNRVYLEPYSVYRVGFWLKVDRTKAAKLLLAAFDNTDDIKLISSQSVVSLTEAETESNYGEWIYYEGDITTGVDISTLGIMLSGGFTTASIDDITVRKLAMKTVSFDSTGGSAVASIDTLEGQYIVAPIEPEKEGYIFDGWYSDTELKNLFEFNSTIINEDIKLYAKWKEIKKQEYKEVITYITEEILEKNEIEDAHLDNKLNILDNDTVSKKATSAKDKAEEDNNLWLIILISIGAFVLVAVGSIIIILLIKRRKKSN